MLTSTVDYVFALLTCALILALSSATVQPASAQESIDKNGITALLGAGLGAGTAGEATGVRVGFSGPSFGIGHFLNPKAATMLRFHRVYSDLEDIEPYRSNYSATTYFLGVGIQYWIREDIPLEFAAGFGLRGDTPETDPEAGSTLALQLGLGNTLYSSGKYNIAINILYLPFFFDTIADPSPFIVHNMSIGLQIQTH